MEDESFFDGVLVGSIPKRDEKIMIGLREFRGARFVDIRSFFPSDGDEWRPSKKGVTIPVEAFPELFEVIAQLAEVLGFNQEN